VILAKRRVLMSVDRSFKEFMDQKALDTGLSAKDLTRDLTNRLTGRSLFESPFRKKGKGGDREIRFNL